MGLKGCVAEMKKQIEKKKICKSNKDAAGVVRTVDWLLQSVWNCLECEKQKMKPTSKTELWRCGKNL